MPRIPRRRRAASRAVASAVTLAVAATTLTAAPSGAHSSTRNDGNDSPGRLDIQTASVAHKNSNVVHRVKTYEGWAPSSLGKDSYFVVGIDTNFDNDFERCAFIFYFRRLRGSLTNCGRTFLRTLSVSKPSISSGRITIPEESLPGAYRWVVFSYWIGPPSRCADLCFDAAPNRPPPILHDLTEPLVTLDLDPLSVWETSTTSTFTFPFSVSDSHSGVKSWRVQSRPEGGSIWTTAASGIGGGAKAPLIAAEVGRVDFRVVVLDMQGNTGISSREVYVPIDDAGLDPSAFSATPSTVEDVDAFGGSYQELALNESFTYEATSASGSCRFALVGPGVGDWVVDVTVGASLPLQITDDQFSDDQRQTLFDLSGGCSDPIVLTFTLTTGSGFGVDAISVST